MRKTIGPASLGAAYLILQRGVDPRGRKEEGDDGGMATVRRHMQRGVATLQGQGRRGREERGESASKKGREEGGSWQESRWGGGRPEAGPRRGAQD